VRLTPQERQQQPAPLLQTPAPVPIPQAPPRPAPAPAARPAPAFPTPQDWSLNGPSRAAPARRKLDLALDPKSLIAPAEPDIKFKGEIGAAWRDGFKAWVEARKYYPEAAIEMSQQGSATVRIVITRDGTVRSVSLIDSSHSPFLDMAWLGLFRGAHLPAFPPGTTEPEITIDATMHYILIR
jgi:protein TonB